ncbi:MAG: DUF3817 domain-containing protein [Bacteroidota bacterium]
MASLLNTDIGRLRLIAFLEGISLLGILFITMPLKYGLHIEGPNMAMGMSHGVLFILYVLAVLIVVFKYKWPIKQTLFSLAASVLPFGTFWADKKYFKPAEEALKNS